MQLGVGSISGRVVGPDGQPVGGVSITATNGEESRTTSSLTEGDVGSYNIPQLSVGGTFTLSVTAPGYLPESRRIPVGGPVGGVNFGLTKTTLTMTGTITSSGNGLGIANAGLTLTTGDLTFRATTAVARTGARSPSPTSRPVHTPSRSTITSTCRRHSSSY